MNSKKKVEVTQVQAQAIEEGKKHYLKMAHEVIGIFVELEPRKPQGLWALMRRIFLTEHFLVGAGDKPPWEGSFAPLNSMTSLDLNRAINYGYIIKEDVEHGKTT